MDREAEKAKYLRCYREPNYRMGAPRMRDAQAALRGLAEPGRSYLDVACGRGEMLAYAKQQGFAPVRGTELVEGLTDGRRVVHAWGHDLPFQANAFDVVSLLDVIEHLVPGDDMAVCLEMRRVARRHVLITANNKPSRNKSGDDLHINIRPYDEWHELFCDWFGGTVHRLRDLSRVSEMWRIDL